MNLIKVYQILAIFLSLYTYDVEGGLALLLLLKIFALKSALFLGVPLALGSFILGNGLGFLGGTLFGAIGVIKLKYKYLSHTKHHAGHHHIYHPQHYHHGYHRWARTTPSTQHGPSIQSTPTPNLYWNDMSALFGNLTSHLRGHRPETNHPDWHGIPDWAQSSTSSLRKNPLKKYKAEDIVKQHLHHVVTTSSPNVPTTSVDWESIFKAAELEEEQKFRNQRGPPTTSNDHSYKNFESYKTYRKPSSVYSPYTTRSNDLNYPAQSGEIYQSPTNARYLSGLEFKAPSDGQDIPDNYKASGENYPNDHRPASDGISEFNSNNQAPTPEGSSSTSKYDGYNDGSDFNHRQGLKYKTNSFKNSDMEKYLEQKLWEEIGSQKSESKKRDAAQLIQMLREAYTQKSLSTWDIPDQINRRSINVMSGIPAFKPFPSVPNSITEALTEAKFFPRRSFSKIDNRMGYVPERGMTLPSLYLKDGFPGYQEPLDRADEELEKVAEDFRKIFLLLSLLDQDSCLQKVICDVHSKGPGEKLTTYESNIVTSFQVINEILPVDVEDSTTKYREAAKIGELGKNARLCMEAFPTCSYTTEQIIDMGNPDDIEPSASDHERNNQNLLASPVDMYTDASEDRKQIAQVPTSSSTINPVTAMPRV